MLAMAKLETGILLIDPAAEGAWNMAVDEVLLDRCEADGRPVLRFYTWCQATLSLGYFQAIADRQQHPASAHLPVVRRMSGGGAIVHDRELTYSLCLPPGHAVAQSAQRFYQTVHDCLVELLQSFQLPASQVAVPLEVEPDHEPFLCFQRRSPGDIVVSGHKIVGSAQRRKRGAVLQHGSLLLGASPTAPELLGAEELVAGLPEPNDWVAPIVERLAPQLAIKFEIGQLDSACRTQAEVLANRKYGSGQWNQRR